MVDKTLPSTYIVPRGTRFTLAMTMRENQHIHGHWPTHIWPTLAWYERQMRYHSNSASEVSKTCHDRGGRVWQVGGGGGQGLHQCLSSLRGCIRRPSQLLAKGAAVCVTWWFLYALGLSDLSPSGSGIKSLVHTCTVSLRGTNFFSWLAKLSIICWLNINIYLRW